MGYCGLRKNTGGKLAGVSPEEGKLSWYHDPLPTNCVGDWVCPGGTGSGYPKYAHAPGPEYGYKNLAVFFHACSFNCLYCQNWHFRNETLRSGTTSVHQLVSDVDEKTSCICYFGGDPTPQLPFALRASKLGLEKSKGRLLRICWETNGSMEKASLDQMIELSLNSGGCIKFDLKAWDENLHIALTGITHKRTLENFSRVGERIRKRSVPPLLIASTLLVPGYIHEDEVGNIARFIASISPEIPYRLLAYSAHFYLSDLPLTSRTLSERCLKAAQEAGLTNVSIGNVHLLA
jgi:pyruvate formate lyase activating enzyme